MSTGLDAQQEKFATNPNDRRAFEALEERYFLDGDWDTLVELYRARLAADAVADDVELKSPLLFRLGQILEERVLNPHAAGEVYWELAKLDPTNRPALRQLRGIHERAERWDMVLQIAELEGQTDMAPYERAKFESELGRYWVERLEDADEAKAAYQRALQADPEFPAALEGLASLYESSERWQDAAELLERLTNRLRGPERAPVWIALGKLNAGVLSNSARAIACFARALEDDPYQLQAVEWSLLLETAAENWQAVSELLEARFDLAAGARHRAAIAVEASQIQLHFLGSSAAARAWVARAEELAPNEIAVLLASAEVDKAEGDDAKRLETLTRLLAVGGSQVPRACLVDAAELLANAGRSEESLAAMTRAAEKPGADDRTLLILQARLVRQTGNKAGLAEILETLTDVDDLSEDAERAAMLRELAELQETELSDTSAALSSWQRAAEIEPSDHTTQSALERLYRKSGDWDSLRSLLESAVRDADREQQLPILVPLGVLILERFDDPGAALVHFDAALEIDPSSQAALSGLRQVAEQTEDRSLLLEVCSRQAVGNHDPDEIGDLAMLCVPVLRERGDFAAAVEWTERWRAVAPGARQALEWQADFEAELGRSEAELISRRALAKLQEGAQRAGTLRRQSEIHAQLEEPTAAAAALEQALEAAPDDLDTLKALCGAYRSIDHPQPLARSLRRYADALPEFDQAPLLEELARVLHDPLGDLEAAIVVRWRIVDLPNAPASAQPDLEALLELAGRYAELVQLLDTQRGRISDEAPEAFELDRRRAQLLLDNLGHCEEAAALFSSLHERNPEDESALVDLERALRAGDDSRGLCALLEKREGWTADPDERIELQFERASLLEQSLGDPIAACDIYETILDARDSSRRREDSADRLVLLLESQGEWQRLRDRLIERIDETEGEALNDLREYIAQISRERLGDLATCTQQLEAIALATQDRVGVWQRLEEIYRNELERPSDWLRVVTAELEAEPDSAREISLRIAVARLLVDERRRPDECSELDAHPHYERILDLDPSNSEAAEALTQHYTDQHQPEAARHVLERRLESFEDVDTTDLDLQAERDALRLRLADLLNEELNQHEAARGHYEALQGVSDCSARVIEPLAQIYEAQDDSTSLAGLAREVLAGGTARRDEALWRRRLASSEHALGHLTEAAAAYRDALKHSPADRDLENALIKIYETNEEFGPLTVLLENRLQYADFDESAELHLKLARIHVKGRSAPNEALSHLEAILRVDPRHRDAYREAIALAGDLGDPQRLIKLLDLGLGTDLPALERAGLLERRGRISAEDLNDREGALPSLREAIALDPTRIDARRCLREQLEKLERWPAVLDCLFIESRQCEGETRVELLEEAAEIARSHLGPDASLPWLARLREERPTDPELLVRTAEVHRRAGRFEAALRAIDEEVELRPESVHRARLHAERARLIERDLGSPGRAIVAYRAALDESKVAIQRKPLLVELDRLYTLANRPTERADILEERVALSSDAECVALRQTLSSLYCVDLVEPGRAVAPLLHNVQDSQQDEAAQMVHLGALGAALRADGQHEAWVRAAEAELALLDQAPGVREATSPDYVRFLREELARIYDEELGNADRAIDHLWQIAQAEVASPRADEHYRSLLRRTGRHAELANALVQRVASEPDDHQAWFELALLREERLHDLAGAASAFAEAARDPQRSLDALRGQRRCCERLQDYPALVSALEAELELHDPVARTERAALARRLGDIAWRQLGDADRAVRGYEQALKSAPQDLIALRALAEIRESQNDIQGCISLYHREIQILADARDQKPRTRSLHLKQASLLASDAQQTRAAIEAFRAADEIEPLDAHDELRMARLYEAAGDQDAFLERFESWCDRDDSNADVRDHLALARNLAASNPRKARERARRATEVDATNCEAWCTLAEAERGADRYTEAANAFARASHVADPTAAPAYCLEAARCAEGRDPAWHWDLLQQAKALDPTHLETRIALARAAADRGLDLETTRETQVVLDLAPAQEVASEIQLELALLGARAARSRSDLKTSRDFYDHVLRLDPDCGEALEGIAVADFEAGDYRAARDALEKRLELSSEGNDRALHLAMIARGLEVDENLDGAWSHYEEAIALDPQMEAAHEGLVRVHERASRLEDAMKCLERWADTQTDHSVRALASLRAAEHALSFSDETRARRNLENATRLDPELSQAWVLLCQILDESGPTDEARRACDAALNAIEPGSLSAQIALRSARLAERSGDSTVARERYAEAARWEPRCVEAALAESRLTRATGDWVGADRVLSQFLEAHPDPQSTSLSHVYLERGRLLSGPLEGFEEAIDAYESALKLQPELNVARTALAGLLLHAPDRWRDALALHREILSNSPTNPNSLRALSQIAESREKPDLAAATELILESLGERSPHAGTGPDAGLPFAISAGPPMADAHHERLRRLAHVLREELEPVFADLEPPRFDGVPDPVANAARRLLEISGEFATPGLVLLDAEARGALFSAIAGLFLDPGGNGAESPYRDAVERALGRWNRRKARRIVDETTQSEIESVDQAAWGAELRAMAAASLIDRKSVRLSDVLRAICHLESATDEGEHLDDAALSTLVDTSETARALLGRINEIICQRLDQDR